jgi:hypothetical protein
MAKKITFQGLGTSLREFGYESRKKLDHIIFEHPDGKQMIVFPRVDLRSEVTPRHRKIVETTIRNDGIVSWDDVEFFLENEKRREDFIKKGDRLLLRVPGSEEETKVSAAADEQDGMVIIKQKGNLSQCPVDRLRKEANIPSQSSSFIK